MRDNLYVAADGKLNRCACVFVCITLGSRERQKWVMEYPSYAFAPKRWTLIRRFYCKLDTWLEGICEPAHPDMWKPSKPASAAGAAAWDATRFSIFSGEGDQIEDDEDDAGDD